MLRLAFKIRVVMGFDRNKGPPLFDESERYLLAFLSACNKISVGRYEMMKGCRWVDFVVEDVPYVAQIDIIDKYQVGE
jgi:ethanolamine-phosphate cytidylyltransferase